MKCDRCDNEAVVHLTEIRRGLTYERHLCERCAQMFLPMESGDFAEYLESLPTVDNPRQPTDAVGGPMPTDDELAMTGLRQSVFVVDVRTRGVRPVGPLRGDSFSPVWSPDSRRLAICHVEEMRHSLVVMERGSNVARTFVNTTFAEAASWSRDSRLICFSHPGEGVRVLLAADVVDGTVHRLSEVPSYDEFSPVWSPTDDLVAFLGRRGEGDVAARSACSVLTTPLDPTKRRRLLTIPKAFLAGLCWSPDGHYVAALVLPFVSDEAEEIFAPPEGTITLILPHAGDGGRADIEGGYLDFAWVPSPAGTPGGPHILAGTSSTSHAGTTVCLVQPVERKPRKLAEGLVFPADEIRGDLLSPDGRTLLAAAGRAADRLVAVDIETHKRRELPMEGEIAWLGWHPSGEEIGMLLRTDGGVRLVMLAADGRARNIAAFGRRDFFDVPRLTFSPDGRYAALEAHAIRKD